MTAATGTPAARGMDASATAVEFLRRFWRGDVQGAADLCTADAIWTFARSLPYPRECQVRDALGLINDGLFQRFDPPGRFEVVLRNVAEARGQVFVEYSATGRLDNGNAYENDYVMAIEVRDGRIVRVRPYTDTMHLAGLFGGRRDP